jgi:hypothetical protein
MIADPYPYSSFTRQIKINVDLLPCSPPEPACVLWILRRSRRALNDTEQQATLTQTFLPLHGFPDAQQHSGEDEHHV